MTIVKSIEEAEEVGEDVELLKNLEDLGVLTDCRPEKPPEKAKNLKCSLRWRKPKEKKEKRFEVTIPIKKIERVKVRPTLKEKKLTDRMKRALEEAKER